MFLRKKEDPLAHKCEIQCHIYLSCFQNDFSQATLTDPFQMFPLDKWISFCLYPTSAHAFFFDNIGISTSDNSLS